MSIRRRIRKLLSRFRSFSLKNWKTSDYKRWNDDSKLLSQWDSRTEQMSLFIPRGMSVLEFGAGRMILKHYLEPGTKYTPSDLVDRGNGTFVCDLNAKKLPVFPVHDVAVFSGVLEYVYNVPRLIHHLYPTVNTIVASYASKDNFPDKMERIQSGWVNGYTVKELYHIFEKAGFHCDKTETWQSQIICRFTKIDGGKNGRF
jgi:hypothetical protein